MYSVTQGTVDTEQHYSVNFEPWPSDEYNWNTKSSLNSVLVADFWLVHNYTSSQTYRKVARLWMNAAQGTFHPPVARLCLRTERHRAERHWKHTNTHSDVTASSPLLCIRRLRVPHTFSPLSLWCGNENGLHTLLIGCRLQLLLGPKCSLMEAQKYAKHSGIGRKEKIQAERSHTSSGS